EVQGDTGGRCADRHNGIDPLVRRRIADDESETVVVRQFVSGPQSLTHRSPDRSKELLSLRIQLLDPGPKLGLWRKFLATWFHGHRILSVVLNSQSVVMRRQRPPAGIPHSDERISDPPR